jgi:hypothetical protein
LQPDKTKVAFFMVSVPRLRASVASLAGPDAEFDAAAWRSDVRLRALDRQPDEPVRTSRLRRWAWLLAIAIHLFVVIGLRIALRRHDAPAADIDVLQVELIDVPSAPPLPEPAPLPRAPRTAPLVARPMPREIPRPIAPSEAAPPAVDELRLFNPDGSANVPDDLAAQIERARPKADFIARDYSPSPILQARRPLKVRPNHFAKVWAGTDGKPLHQQFFDSLIVVKEFTAPWGGHYGCAWLLIIVTCADVPDKPWNPPTTWQPATEQDEY